MLILPKKLLAVYKVKRHNSHQMSTILRISREHVNAHGPAIVEGDGPTYIHPVTKVRDAIAILAPNWKRWHFSVISSDANSKAARAIARNFLIEYDYSAEILRFKDFLQAIQDAHDYAFYYDKDVVDRMKLFNEKCDQIKVDFKL